MAKSTPTKSQASKAGSKLASGSTSKSTKSDSASTLSRFGHKTSSSGKSSKK